MSIDLRLVRKVLKEITEKPGELGELGKQWLRIFESLDDRDLQQIQMTRKLSPDRIQVLDAPEEFVDRLVEVLAFALCGFTEEQYKRWGFVTHIASDGIRICGRSCPSKLLTNESHEPH